MRPRIGWALVAACAVVVVLLCAWRYWLADDAWITFRVVDNALHGEGLRWNTVDRVQVYSHPLWMLLLLVAIGITREFVFTPIALSLTCTGAALATIAFRASPRWPIALGLVAVLGASKAFADYATSGLENALGYAIVAVAAVSLVRRPSDARVPALCFGLAATTRIEWLVLLGPPVLWLAFADRRQWRWVGLGLLPFLLWEGFALAYYGFPLPSPYYAKIFTGLPLSERLWQGWRYLLDSLGTDPVTVGVVSLAPFVAYRRWPSFALALGAVAASVLVVLNGGDFMSGRFFAVPFVAAVGAVAAVSWEDWRRPVRLALAGAAGLLAAVSLGRTLFVGLPGEWAAISQWGIADERAVYSGKAGVAGSHPPRAADGGPDAGIPAMPGETAPGARFGSEPPGGSREAPPDGRAVRRDMAGRQGFSLGPKVMVVDSFGLGDPLLARVPALYSPVWRPGHHERVLPDRYLAEVVGTPRLDDPELQAYQQDLLLVTRGALFSPARLWTIAKLNLGLHGHHPDWEAWRFPKTRVVPADQVATPKATGTSVREESNVFFGRTGVRVEFGAPQHAPGIEVSVNSRFHYWLVYELGGKPVGSVGLSVRDEGAVLRVFDVPVPDDAVEAGFDVVWVLPRDPAGRFALGHVRLLDERPLPVGPPERPPR